MQQHWVTPDTKGKSNMNRRAFFVFCLLLLTSVPAVSQHLSPLETVRNGVEAGLLILNDPELKAPHRFDEKQQKLRIILEQLFDFEVFSRAVLASRWKDFTPSQQVIFVNVFTEFLSRYYIGKLLERYVDERVDYLDQTLKSPTRALVNAAVVWNGRQVPVDLPMIRREGAWKIYEIQVLGISAASFYRAQFKYLLSKERPAQVIERIRQRIQLLESR
jgi:phospholipid transport system substrate-binding protein